MKNDKKWLRESVNELKTTFNGMKMGEYETGRLDGYNHVSMLIDYLDEPEKPIIPRFVADYIERWKPEGLTICEWFTFGNNDMDDDIEKWLYDNTTVENTRREYLLIDAIRYGYEVEKEKNYRVVFPYKGETVYLKEGVHGDFDVIETETYGTQYTEAEIKAIDERYWVFAEEVTK